MQLTNSSTFEQLRGRLGGTVLDPANRAIELERLIEYLNRLGSNIVTAGDVLSAIEADPTEEELSAYRCAEGVAVSHATDGWWLLFPHGRLEPPMHNAFKRTSLASRDRA